MKRRITIKLDVDAHSHHELHGLVMRCLNGFISHDWEKPRNDTLDAFENELGGRLVSHVKVREPAT